MAIGEQPETRGLILVTLHSAAKELFGADGLRAIGAALPVDVRAATIDSPPLALAWYPTAHIVAWWHAVAMGPGREEAMFLKFVDRSNDLGFGRVRKALLGFVGPEGLVARAAELWRHDNSTGKLEILATLPPSADGLTKGGVKARLSDHPYAETEIARRGILEALRHILSLARGVDRVTVTHAVERGTLVMTFVWS